MGMLLELWILSGMKIIPVFRWAGNISKETKLYNMYITIILRDNLEAVYLQSDDMGGISFTTGRMEHAIQRQLQSIQMNYQTQIFRCQVEIQLST